MNKLKKPVLPDDTNTHYFYLEPVYDHYKKVKVIDRCECCNHKTGEHFEEKGIKVIDYKVNKAKKDSVYYLNKTMHRYYAPKVIESILGKKAL